MATIGLKKPYAAKYKNTSGTVSYEDGTVIAKAVEFSAAITSAENNNLYADDGIAETDKSFAGGTITITTDDLSQEASKLILGLKENEVTVGQSKVTELVFDDDASAPDLGFGIIVPRRKSGVNSYRAIVFLRVKFSIPEESYKTRGENIEWQTPKLTATVMRSEASKAPWKRQADCDDEETAEAYVKQVLNITGA